MVNYFDEYYVRVNVRIKNVIFNIMVIFCMNVLKLWGFCLVNKLLVLLVNEDMVLLVLDGCIIIVMIIKMEIISINVNNKLYKKCVF